MLKALKRIRNQELRRAQSGFTIIEVMIVIAVAGLILAIVFIAVPALQRNSRDAQRRADIAALQSGVATFVGNNNGQVPDVVGDLTASVSGLDRAFYNLGPTAYAAAVAENQLYFVARSATAPAIATGTTDVADYAIYLEDAECLAALATTPVAKTTAFTAGAGNLVGDGDARSYAIIYALENDPNWQCVDNT